MASLITITSVLPSSPHHASRLIVGPESLSSISQRANYDDDRVVFKDTVDEPVPDRSEDVKFDDQDLRKA
jgi:hypothetical protein